MIKLLKTLFSAAFLSLLASAPAFADDYADTVKVFEQAGVSGNFFKSAYGYAVFPSIGKAGVGVGGAYGKGRVYEMGRHVGDTSVTQVSVGLQLGGQAYSEIIFFEDQRALREFTSGNFEFGAGASAVAITAAASAKTTTGGSSASASGGQHDAKTVGKYHKGMAVFTVAKGGLMYEASVSGQKFSYKAVK
ncbi:MAG TPA: YSC84-related protein [Usitatibacteraceae bacterium]|nr:YSC84-related protein [Usitatibacteraceae bacterium]